MAYIEIPPGLFAFWKHDMFPYFLGGEITHMNESGSTYTKEYGSGFGFNPAKIVPTEAGKKILADLEELVCIRDAAIKSVKNDFDAKVNEMMRI